MFEAGMLPGIAYYLSRWYRRGELAFRLSMYIVMAPLAGAFGGLLASAILSLGAWNDVRIQRTSETSIDLFPLFRPLRIPPFMAHDLCHRRHHYNQPFYHIILHPH